MNAENLTVVPTNGRFDLPKAQLADLYGRLKALFNCLPENRQSTGNAKYKVADEKKTQLPEWWTKK